MGRLGQSQPLAPRRDRARPGLASVSRLRRTAGCGRRCGTASVHRPRGGRGLRIRDARLPNDRRSAPLGSRGPLGLSALCARRQPLPPGRAPALRAGPAIDPDGALAADDDPHPAPRGIDRASQARAVREVRRGRPAHPLPTELRQAARPARGAKTLGGAATRSPRAPERLVRRGVAAGLISAIVISRDDGTRILPTVRSVVEQRCDEPLEVIVVTSGTGDAAALVRRHFANVTVVELEHPALPGEARNAGLSLARGDYISFPGSHVELPQGSLAARIAAHDLGYAMVTGSIVNGTDTPAGWASYFLDHAWYMSGRPSGELSGPPAHCSYMREPL